VACSLIGAAIADDGPADATPRTENAGAKLDRIHAAVYDFLQHQVVLVDHWFVKQGRTPLEVPPFELRVGWSALAARDTANGQVLTFPVDLDARVRLPNASRRLKLMLTTHDPTVIPGTSPLDESLAARVGVVRSWTEDIHATLGVRASAHGRLYAHVDWGPTWSGGRWKFYPFERLYWQSMDGFGEITSLVADRWRDRWDFRMAGSIKWSEAKRDIDRRDLNEERGVEWDANAGLYYARELLREHDIGRIVNGADLARATGLRVSVFGGPGHLNSGRIAVLQKGELWSRWIYYVIAPEVEWSRVSAWKRQFRLLLGVELFFREDRRGSSGVPHGGRRPAAPDPAER
jgi:hypothetical protein